MPFKSKTQMRKFYALEAEGKLPQGTAKRWLAKYGKPTKERVAKKKPADPPLMKKASVLGAAAAAKAGGPKVLLTVLSGVRKK